MSGYQLDRSRPFQAGEDLSTKQYCFVKLGATQNTVVAATAATDEIIGILENAPKLNWEAKVVLLNGQGSMTVIASGAITKGSKVTCNNAGKATATVNSGDYVCGVAVDTVNADGDHCEIILSKYKN